MKKLGNTGSKILKGIHILFVALWVGGVASWVPLLFGTSTSEVGTTYLTYLNMRAIAWNVIGWGGMGSFFTGVLNSILTNWGILKYKWVTLKFLLVIGQILFGMFFIESRLLQNISIVETEGSSSVSNAIFQENHLGMQKGILLQFLLFSFIIFISILKPWGTWGKVSSDT